MLAEAKCKRRYTLVPKGKALYEDESRFGTKIMKKMGWSKGKGLGRDEKGSEDFIRVHYKNDSKGLGFQYLDDQWTEHERCFNGLLSTLNGEKDHDDSTESETKRISGDNSEDNVKGFGFNLHEESRTKTDKVEKLKEKTSGVSLEEKSKQSKARVHYKKFTRGKDLSQYSEKDLANIFGKKVNEEQQLLNPLREEENQDNEKYNSQFLYSSISISDYFKMKMGAKKNNKENGPNCADITVCRQDDASGEVQDEVSEKRRKKRKKNKQDDVEVGDEKEGQIVENKKKKSRKDGIQDLKSRNNENGNHSTNVNAIEVLEDFKEEINIKSKSKNKKKKVAVQEKQQVELENSLKINQIDYDNLENVMKYSPIISKDIIEVNLTEEKQKKKRKGNKKDKNEAHANDNIEEVETISEEQQHSTGKNKKISKSCKQTEEVSNDTNYQKSLNVVTKKSHKNKMKNLNDVNIKELELDEMEKLQNSFNVYPISSFCAEKFRNINLTDFTGSTLPEIEGYGFNSEIQLDVHINKKDEERIMNLWKGILNKYDHLGGYPKKIYQNYVKEVIEARKTNRKRPKLHIKTWKRKNAFQII